jgi:hypothetical protein
MDLGKMQFAGAGEVMPHVLESFHLRRQEENKALLYGGIALGVLAGAALSTYVWMQRSRASNLHHTPIDRAEALISSCESKIADIEQAIEELKEATR